MKKIVFAVIGIFLAYHSIYFRKLSEMKTKENTEFNFNKLADSLYYQGIMNTKSAVNISNLIALKKSNQDSAFATFGNRLGIGNTAFFMVSFSGKIIEKSEQGLLIRSDGGADIWIDTKFIFGNAIRDASRMVKLTDFKTNADFNKLSEALNTIIREKAMPQSLSTLEINQNIDVLGAIKLTKNMEETMPLTILPVKLTKKF